MRVADGPSDSNLANRPRRQINALIPPIGKGCCYVSVWITDQRYGPLHLAIAYVITPYGAEKWAIISGEPVGRHTFDEYGLRFDYDVVTVRIAHSVRLAEGVDRVPPLVSVC